MKVRSLRQQFRGALLLVALLPLCVFVFSQWIQFRDVREQTVARQKELVELFSKDLQDALASKRESLEEAAVSIGALQAASDGKDAGDLVAHLLYSAGHRFSRTVLLTVDGKFEVASAGVDKESAEAFAREFSGSWAFRTALKRQQSAVGETREKDGGVVLFIAAPVLEWHGERVFLTGVIGTEVDVSAMLAELVSPYLPARCRLVVSDAAGGTIAELGALEEGPTIVSRAQVRLLDWVLVYEAPDSELFSKANMVALFGFTVSLVVLLVVYVVGRRSLRRFSDFFEALMGDIRKLRRGEVPGDDPREINGVPEAERILREFRIMARHLSESHQEIRRINAGLEERVEERTFQLKRANEELAAANALLRPMDEAGDDGAVFSEAFRLFKEAHELAVLDVVDELPSPEASGESVRLVDGRWLRAVPSRPDPELRGAVLRLVDVINVVLENERLLGEVRRRNASLAAVFSSMSEGFALIHEGRLVEFNARFERMMKEAPEGALLFEALQNGKGTGNPFAALPIDERDGTWTHETVSGRMVSVFVDVFDVELPGERHALGVTLRDVTHDKEVGKLKDDVIALVSHELNNPVATIGVGLETLERARGRLTPEVEHEIIRRLAGETERLKVLIRDWLDVSMLNNGVVPTRREPADLPGLIRRLVDERAGGDDVVFSAEGTPGHLMCNVDRSRIEQVFTNLFSNALRYNQSEVKTVHVSWECRDGAFVVHVADNGMGIPEEERESVFDQFYRGARAKGHAPNGSGLGLAICRAIMRAHQGDLWIESSEPGKGTVFVMRLPIE